MTGKDFDTLNEAYRTKVSEALPAVAAIARVAGPALARGAASGAGMAAGEKMMGDQDEDPGDEAIIQQYMTKGT